MISGKSKVKRREKGKYGGGGILMDPHRAIELTMVRGGAHGLNTGARELWRVVGGAVW